MWHAWGRRKKCASFWWESPKEIDHSDDQWEYGIRMALKEIGWEGGMESVGSG
jgi:hypothetical protein